MADPPTPHPSGGGALGSDSELDWPEHMKRRTHANELDWPETCTHD